MHYTEADLERIRNERSQQERFIRFLYQRANSWLDFTEETADRTLLTLDEQSLYPDRHNQDSIRFYVGEADSSEEHFIPISYIFNYNEAPTLTVPDFLSREDIIALQKDSTPRSTSVRTSLPKHPGYDPKFGWDDETPDSWRHLPEDREN